MSKIGTATIKFTDSEIGLLINSLEMSISTIVPCVDNGEWKKPYEILKKDLVDINRQLKEKIKEIPYEAKRSGPASCEPCED
jgi:hypothetical protein|tara:strand:+ start:1920 stop:2165 length:246 start_codon:yes stop_codon:yes gene_type:complete